MCVSLSFFPNRSLSQVSALHLPHVLLKGLKLGGFLPSFPGHLLVEEREHLSRGISRVLDLALASFWLFNVLFYPWVSGELELSSRSLSNVSSRTIHSLLMLVGKKSRLVKPLKLLKNAPMLATSNKPLA